MRAKNTYFHDRIVLFFLSINSFIALVYLLFFAVQFDSSGNYIVQYRADASVDEYKSGNATDILSLPLFVIISFIAQVIVSKKLHGLNQHVAWATMFLTLLVLIIAFLSTVALFRLR